VRRLAWEEAEAQKTAASNAKICLTTEDSLRAMGITLKPAGNGEAVVKESRDKKFSKPKSKRKLAHLVKQMYLKAQAEEFRAEK
jgi:hypothetical protein